MSRERRRIYTVSITTCLSIAIGAFLYVWQSASDRQAAEAMAQAELLKSRISVLEQRSMRLPCLKHLSRPRFRLPKSIRGRSPPPLPSFVFAAKGRPAIPNEKILPSATDVSAGNGRYHA